MLLFGMISSRVNRKLINEYERIRPIAEPTLTSKAECAPTATLDNATNDAHASGITHSHLRRLGVF
jgi:hypothetical protein